jgi:copper homeostasis protein
MIVEICASNFESAMAAREGGANRIELCEQLGVGGLTPSYQLIERVINEIDAPVHVLIRPRSGDFCYSESELNSMLDDIAFCKNTGCAGIVSGVLTPENEIDALATGRLIAACDELSFTFHRAFDLCIDPFTGLRSLLNLNVDRLLSSGQQLSATEGLQLLKQLKAHSEGTIEIMPGGGITDQNAMVFIEAGFHSIHLSAIKKSGAATSLFNIATEGVSDLEMIKTVVDLAQRKSFGSPPGSHLDH